MSQDYYLIEDMDNKVAPLTFQVKGQCHKIVVEDMDNKVAPLTFQVKGQCHKIGGPTHLPGKGTVSQDCCLKEVMDNKVGPLTSQVKGQCHKIVSCRRCPLRR